MFTISRQFSLCYAHRLRSHAGKCAHLHGHNAMVRIDLRAGHLNPQGMVTDFVDIKGTIGQWIETTLDHHLILSESDPLVDILREHGEAVLSLPDEPTAENLARLIYEKAEEIGLPVHSVAFGETANCTAEYRKI